MYPHSRETQSSIPDKQFKTIVTAEFEIPLQLDCTAEDVKPFPRKIFPRNLERHRYPRTNRDGINIPPINAIGSSQVCLRIGIGETSWNFDAAVKWLGSARSHPSDFPLLRGTIHFRSKYFGRWEPFEYTKYFIVDKPVTLDNSGDRILEPIFSLEQLETTMAMFRDHSKDIKRFTLEMTLTLDHVCFFREENRLLCVHATKVNNALISPPKKTDFRIKVCNEEYFVHLEQIKAFSSVSEILSKYMTKSDWSDVLCPESMQALLRFIYYNEINTINNPEVAFQLMRFGHMYEVPSLFRICENSLMSFSDEMFPLADLFEMYLFVRVPDEFRKLKQHFCRMLAENAPGYDTAELKELAKRNEDGSGVDVLVEILQFGEEPSSPKRPRTATD